MNFFGRSRVRGLSSMKGPTRQVAQTHYDDDDGSDVDTAPD